MGLAYLADLGGVEALTVVLNRYRGEFRVWFKPYPDLFRARVFPHIHQGFLNYSQKLDFGFG